ncbi:MAG: potassium channel family protein [Acidobacteria bacterium]|nr:potassium channel family protein [Acidobacteriota bacterium]
MKTIISTAAGVGLLLLIIYDVYATVLHSSARYGPIGERMNRGVWRLARTLAFKLPRMHRHKFLNLVGPLLMPLLLLTYIVLLVNAFALIYYPHLQSSFVISRDAPGTGFAEALYFSGLTLTTVGYGDIVPHTTPMRFVAVFEAAMGIISITLAITYLLTVYGALEHKRIAALSLYHQAGEGADAAGFIAHHYVEGKFYGLRSALSTATRDLQALLESHVEHPVIHYFHPSEVYKSLPRMLFLLLESCSIIQTSLDSEENSDLRNYPEVRTLEAISIHLGYDWEEITGDRDLDYAADEEKEKPQDERLEAGD